MVDRPSTLLHNVPPDRLYDKPLGMLDRPAEVSCDREFGFCDGQSSEMFAGPPLEEKLVSWPSETLADQQHEVIRSRPPGQPDKCGDRPFGNVVGNRPSFVGPPLEISADLASERKVVGHQCDMLDGPRPAILHDRPFGIVGSQPSEVVVDPPVSENVVGKPPPDGNVVVSLPISGNVVREPPPDRNVVRDPLLSKKSGHPPRDRFGSSLSGSSMRFLAKLRTHVFDRGKRFGVGDLKVKNISQLMSGSVLAVERTGQGKARFYILLILFVTDTRDLLRQRNCRELTGDCDKTRQVVMMWTLLSAHATV